MQSNDPILIVEDDMVDAVTVTKALKDLKVPNDIIHTTNGEEALDYLSNPVNPRPCIILLDINMPKMNGIEFLRAAKSREDFSLIPVVMLTTSTSDRDMIESFNLNVASYIVKPVDHKQLVDTVETVEAFLRLGRVQK
jgi:CheY-like chemotaxis protein